MAIELVALISIFNICFQYFEEKSNKGLYHTQYKNAKYLENLKKFIKNIVPIALSVFTNVDDVISVLFSNKANQAILQVNNDLSQALGSKKDIKKIIKRCGSNNSVDWT